VPKGLDGHPEGCPDIAFIIDDEDAHGRRRSKIDNVKLLILRRAHGARRFPIINHRSSIINSHQ
jgi:hypothetical protein